MIQPSALVLKSISDIHAIPTVLLKILKRKHLNNGKRSIL